MIAKNVLKQNKFEASAFIFTAFLYLSNNFVLKEISAGVVNYFFVCYFNDLICPFGFVSYTNMMLFFINKKIEKFHHVLIFCFLCGLVWEFIAPLLKESSVTDPCDLFCYCAGGAVYWIIRCLYLKIKGDKK